MKYVVPDVVVEKVDGEYQVVTNEGTIPRLMVSSYYMSLAEEGLRMRNFQVPQR